ncbi:MAG: S8 family serine peptidase [Calditrichota bacterium]
MLGHPVDAGNDGQDVYGADGQFGTSDDFIPAAYPEVAAISALADADGQPGGTGGSTSYGGDDSFASFSNYSASVAPGNPVTSPGKAIDLILPGVDILSTYMNGGYAIASGTSMASPHATGLAALYIAAHGRATSASGVYSIRQALIDNGVAQSSAAGLATLNDPDGNEENLGWASAASTTTPVTDIAVSSVSAPSGVTTGDVVSVKVTVRNTGNQDVSSDIGVNLTDVTDGVFIGTQTVSGGLTAGASVTLTFSWNTGSASVGDHILTAHQNFTDDKSSNDSNSTVVNVSEPSAGVAVDGINPNSVQAGSSVDVTITGSGFTSGAAVSFENGSGPAPSASGVTVADGGTITATVSTKSGGPPGARVWDVRVTNPDGSSGLLSGGFTVSR